MAKIAIVTGGCRGIGLAISKRLARDGYQVVTAGRKGPQDVKDALTSIASEGLSPLYVQADVSLSDDRKRILSQTIKEFGRVDLLVNNAGVAPRERKNILEMSEESWDYVIDTNTKSNMFMTQLVANAMLEQDVIYNKRGTIINISSSFIRFIQ